MDCPERKKLVAAYKEAINTYIHTAGNLRYATGSDLTDRALAASEAAQQACDSAREALEQHVAEHGCGRKSQI